VTLNLKTLLKASEEFWKLVSSAAQITEVYVDMYLEKNPTRTSILSGMGWLLETLRTPGECHTQLRMNTTIFLDLHDLLFFSSYAVEMSPIGEPRIGLNTQGKPLGENLMRF
jgi:hypothetical protein